MLDFLFCYFFLCKDTTDIEFVIRKFIRKNVKKGTSIEEVDKKISEKFGEDAIAYQELDYWYYQFYNGKRSLKDKRSPSNSPRELLDLPNEMIAEIISKLPISQRLDLAKVSYRLQGVTDLRTEFMDVIITDDSMKLCFERTFVDSVFLPNNNAYQELRKILNNPKLKLDQLIFDATTHMGTNEQQARKIERMLQTLDQKVHTTAFNTNMFHFKDLLIFLPFLKPGVLEVIKVYHSRLNEAEQLDEPEPFLQTIQKLQELDQWNQITCLDFSAKYPQTLVTCPVDYFFHLEVLWFQGPICDKFDVILSWITEFLTKSPKVEAFVARNFALKFPEICSLISSEIVIKWTDEFAGRAIFKIPDADKVFKISREWHDDRRNVAELVVEKVGAPSHLIPAGQSIFV
ncbi:hypothetical protein CAEBREN_18075 [Caenorhabditis brenneri]|uniref:F-box domain-containing protein n=1 Tax=Caenorhabditis brenneri TaxID=135651 RepID=G0P055_CAEBE|nr:hypothetical protein CAEBREN_18075 [Caenorhabditis brenneri]